MKKNYSFIFTLFLITMLSSCAAIGDIFKTGVGVGIAIVVVVVIIIIFIIRSFSSKS